MYNIEIKNVTKRYNDKLAVDNLSININERELFGLLGPNGAGKSTLISMICGLISFDRGDIFVGGNSIKKDPIKVKKLIGYVPQEISLLQGLSIIDNLQYFGRMCGLKGTKLKEKINETLELIELSDRKKDKVNKLSGGMKRRLNIGCAILHEPKILIMDEPTVGIDPQSRNQILEFIKKINKEKNTTIIYTSHYMEEIEALCDNLVIMDMGKDLVKGSKNEILRTFIDEMTLDILIPNVKEEIQIPLGELEGVRRVSIKENTVQMVVKSNDYKIEDIFKVINHNGCSVKNLNIDAPNLETVFLRITGKNLRE